MSTFAPDRVQTAALDPFKHVNYIQGMVLGVADFDQEFAYLAGRDQWMTRDLLGYGTVCGLQVTARQAGSDGWEIVVAAGTAVNPRGEWIRVPAAQCARLRNWVEAHGDEIRRYAGSPPDELRVYVVLCYRDCEVDPVPLPGEPCRSEDETFQPSRVQDDYGLELWFEPPRQTQEDAIRDVALWLSGIPVAAIADSDANRAMFLEALRNAVPHYQSPPASPPTSPPDYMLGSPPDDLRIPAAARYDYLRLAFRVWVTELRPLWLGSNQTCSGLPPDERCVLLAAVNIPLTDEGLLSDVAAVTIDEERRPYLLSLRMLQEWLFRAAPESDSVPITLAGDVVDEPGANIVAGIQGAPVIAPDPVNQAGHLLSFSGVDWQLVPPPSPGGGVETLAGDAQGAIDGTRVTGLHGLPITAPVSDDSGRLLSFNGSGWELVPPPTGPRRITLGGDVINQSNSNTVAGLQNFPLTAPTRNRQVGHLLSFSGSDWQLVPPPAAGAGTVVAAGRFDADGNIVFNFRDLVARRVDFDRYSFYFLTFDGISDDVSYVIKATIVNALLGSPRLIEAIDRFEVEQNRELMSLIEEFNNREDTEIPIELSSDLVVRIAVEGDDVRERIRGFMIEISQF